MRPRFATFVLLVVCRTASAQMSATTEARYLAGLRERRLFVLVESYCRSESATAANERRRSELAIELCRTSLEAAFYAKSPEREQLIAAAERAIDEPLAAKPASIWRTPLEVQRALVDLAWGERLREEAQTLNAANAALEPARARIRAAIARLKSARDALDEQLRDLNRRGDTPAPDSPTAHEWAALRRNLEYQLARAFRNQGESYAAGSADRAAALEQAVESYELLGRAELTDAVTWQARLDEAACKRLLGDGPAAARMLALIESQAPPPEVADRARAELIRLLIAANQLDEARKLVRPEETEGGVGVEPDVRLAALELLLASGRAAQRSGDSKSAADWQNRAAAMTRLIAEHHSPYWARRAEGLLAAAVVASPATNDFAALEKAAASVYQQGNADRALEIYDQLAAQAVSAKQPIAAFSAGFTAAAIEQERGRHAAAAARFVKLAADFAGEPRTAEAHLLAIYNTGLAAAADDPTIAEAALARYGTLLRQHIEQWPAGATSAQSRLWLGRLHSQGGKHDEAVAVLRGVSPGDPLAADAVTELASAAESGLREAALRNDGTLKAKLAEAEATLTSFAPGYPGRLNEPTTPAGRAAARHAAAFHLTYADDRFAESAALLDGLLQTAELPAAERTALLAWSALAEAGAGRIEAANRQLAAIDSAPPIETTIVVARLDQLAAKRPAAEHSQWGTAVLRLVELLQPYRNQPAANWIDVVAAPEARALARVGRLPEARAAWQSLIRERPDDAEMQIGHAEFLLSQDDADSLSAAAVQWREVQQRSEEGDPAWLRARLGLAETYAKQGDLPRALQLIELTRALHPDFGGEEMKRRYEELAAHLKER